MQHALIEIPHGYRVSFYEDTGEPAYIDFDVTYIDNSRGWGLLATVEVSSQLPEARVLDPSGTLLMDRMNIMKSQERERMSRRIDGLIPNPKSGAALDWQHHIEHMAILINRKMCEPIATQHLQDHELVKREKFLINGLLAKNKTNIIYGPGGTGKSLLALRIGGAVVTGQNIFGFQTNDIGGVLYCDWEDDAVEMVSRLTMVSRGMGLSERYPIAYKGYLGKGPYERHHNDVKLFAQTKDVKLIIIDSTAMAMHGSSAGDGADGAIKFFQLLAQLETTVLLIDHVASDDIKSNDSRAPKPYGSVFKVNAARNMWEVTAWNSGSIDGLTLTHRKSNVGPKLSPVGVSVDWHPEHISFTDMSKDEADYITSLNN